MSLDKTGFPRCPGCRRAVGIVGSLCIDCRHRRAGVAPNVHGLVSFLRAVYADGATKLARDVIFSAWPKLSGSAAIDVLTAEISPGHSAVDVLRDHLDGTK